MSPIDSRLSDKIKLISIYCAVLVTFNHAYTVDATYAELANQPGAALNCSIQSFIKFGLARVSTPFFFVLSAWLLFSQAGSVLHEWWPNLRKRLRTLGVPFLFWSLWSFAIIATLQQVPALRAFSSEPLLALRGWDLAERLLWNPIAHQLWFVRDLLLLVAAAPLVHLAMRNRWIGGGIIVALMLLWYQPEMYMVRDVRGVLFFCVGAWIALHRPVLRATRTQAFVALGAWLGLIAVDTWWTLDTGDLQPAIYNTAIVVGLLTLWALYEHVGERLWTTRAAPALRFLSGYTFLIYVAHEPIDTLVRKALTAVIGRGQGELFVVFLATGTIVICGILTAAVLAQRFAPGAYALVSGGRGGRRRSEATSTTRNSAVLPGLSRTSATPA